MTFVKYHKFQSSCKYGITAFVKDEEISIHKVNDNFKNFI